MTECIGARMQCRVRRIKPRTRLVERRIMSGRRADESEKKPPASLTWRYSIPLIRGLRWGWSHSGSAISCAAAETRQDRQVTRSARVGRALLTGVEMKATNPTEKKKQPTTSVAEIRK